MAPAAGARGRRRSADGAPAPAAAASPAAALLGFLVWVVAVDSMPSLQEKEESSTQKMKTGRPKAVGVWVEC